VLFMPGPKIKVPPAVEPETDDERLDEGLEDSFPASDPAASTQPHPYWDTHPETD
jgi:hypothetical protein